MGAFKDIVIGRQDEQRQLDDEYDQFHQDSTEHQKEQEEEQAWAERVWEAEREDAIELDQILDDMENDDENR